MTGRTAIIWALALALPTGCDRPGPPPPAPTADTKAETPGPADAARASKDDAVKQEMERLRGRRRTLSLSFVVDGERRNHRGQGWEVAGDTFGPMAGPPVPGFDVTEEDSISQTMTLDPARRPKEVTLTDKAETFLGIYKLEADTLTLCVARKKRPTEFAAAAGSGRTLHVLKREESPNDPAVVARTEKDTKKTPVEAAPAPDTPAGKELSELQGTWVLTSSQGQLDRLPGDPEEESKNVFKLALQKWSFVGNRFGVVGPQGKLVDPRTVRLDLGRNPKAIDLLFKVDGKVEKVAGIYKLEGKTLTICHDRDGTDRPESFESSRKASHSLFVFGRE